MAVAPLAAPQRRRMRGSGAAAAAAQKDPTQGNRRHTRRSRRLPRVQQNRAIFTAFHGCGGGTSRAVQRGRSKVTHPRSESGGGSPASNTHHCTGGGHFASLLPLLSAVRSRRRDVVRVMAEAQRLVQVVARLAANAAAFSAADSANTKSRLFILSVAASECRFQSL